MLGLVGCSKSEPTSTAASTQAPAATAAVPAKTTAPDPAALVAAARESLANLKLPDFKKTTVEDLAGLATQTLTQWSQTVEKPSASVLKEVDAVKAALSKSEPLAALGSLTKLGEQVKSIPGAEALLQSTKQLVSAWALKQGFDAAKISGVLGALQSGDYAGLATQATGLLAKGGVSGDQKKLLEGVLGTFGVDAGNAAGAVNAVKGLLGK